jgi:miniconductance mechanosensitive channel
VLFGKNPGFFLGGLGAFTAVIMLIFKDSILGFVAGIQLTRNDMVRIGDWIEMPKYNADGDVIDVSLNTVKVQNWDKTIATIPTYVLMTDSFRNWRGMADSGGRRIKRALYIDMNSIKFCTEQMLDRFARFEFIRDYIDRKRKEVADYNVENHVDDSQLVNGRRLTNVGTFRAYVEAYLRNHPKVHQDMTFLIRQLAPTEHGLPLEIYVFSNDQVWANYEAIQSDIFDHVLAVVPQFDLRVFQTPSGMDLVDLAKQVKTV